MNESAVLEKEGQPKIARPVRISRFLLKAAEITSGDDEAES